MSLNEKYFQNRIITLKRRIKTITSLKELVPLPPEQDILAQQWFAIEMQLSQVASKLLQKVKLVSQELLPLIHEIEYARELNSQLAKIEKELSKAYFFFDTMLDTLTPRLSPKLGLLLLGCDVIANDALKQIKHPVISTVVPPILILDRGYGASILREGVPAPANAENPVASIQIPYDKIKQKYLLVSILHEVGHQQDVSLGLRSEIPKAMKIYLKKLRASELIQNLFVNWTSEIMADFIAFLILGAAQSISTREILSFTPSMVFKVSNSDPHPPAWLRVRFSMDWCRQIWGYGPWDKWEKEWMRLYPLISSEPFPTLNQKKIITSAEKYIPVLTSFLFQTKFKALGGRTIPSVFVKPPVSPFQIKNIIQNAKQHRILNFKDLTPSQQLAVFVMMKYTEENISEESIDKIMTLWLTELGKIRRRIFI